MTLREATTPQHMKAAAVLDSTVRTHVSQPMRTLDSIHMFITSVYTKKEEDCSKCFPPFKINYKS